MASSYDRVTYSSDPRPQTHPSRLAAVATLFGMTPAPPESCRVLELGCGDGSNLVPMAFGLPGSIFVGIDSAAAPIARARQVVEELRLGNITVRQMDVMDLGPDVGRFDYIIAHGLYSWVPASVQDKILAISKANLSPAGVAYVSYSTYPGAYLRQMIREMMCFHIKQVLEPEKRITEAVALVRYLGGSWHCLDEVRAIMEKECGDILAHEPGHLYHDELAEINTPVYFWQFMERASAHGLQYLGEVQSSEMLPSPVEPGAAELPPLPVPDDIVSKEQYGDFLRLRRFRQTLLCHDSVPLNRNPRPEQMTGLYVASAARPVSEAPNLSEDGEEHFQVTKGERVATLSTNHPLAKAALLELGESWPLCMRLRELAARARARLREWVGEEGACCSEDESLLGEVALKLYMANLAELTVSAPLFTLQISERPAASPLARFQAQTRDRIVNLRHSVVEATDEAVQRLLLLLDGTRDRRALRRELGEMFGREVSEQELEENLRRAARLALLVV